MRAMHHEDESLAANGRPVRDNFADWFASSAMRCADGAPRIFFHGTNQSFDSFEHLALGRNAASMSSVLGIWVSSCPHVAAEYADMAARNQVVDQLNHEERISAMLKRIKIAEARGRWDEAERLTEEVEEMEYGAIRNEPQGQIVIPLYARANNPLTVHCESQSLKIAVCSEIIEQAKSQGHDGVLFCDSNDSPTCKVSDHLVVFDPRQLKSALGNAGLFMRDEASLTDHDASLALVQAMRAKDVAAQNLIRPSMRELSLHAR